MFVIKNYINYKNKVTIYKSVKALILEKTVSTNIYRKI